MANPVMTIYAFLAWIAEIAVATLSYGFLVKGGVSWGPLVHSGSICYGPAMLEAVALEQGYSEPKILIHRKLLMDEDPRFVSARARSCRKVTEYDFSTLSSVVSHGSSTPRHPTVGAAPSDRLIPQYFLDYLYRHLTRENEPLIRKLLENMRVAAPSRSAMEKHEWMKLYLNATLACRPDLCDLAVSGD
jgi:hypothetical protein